MVDPILLIAAQALAWSVLLCSLVAAVVIVERFVVLGKKRVAIAQLAVRLRTVLRRGDPAELESFCGQKRSPPINTLRRFSGLWRTSQAARSSLYERAAGEELEVMEQRLPLLATLAGATPMLGVLSLLSAYSHLLVGGQDQPSPWTGPFQPFSIAAAALLTGIVTLVMYNLFVMRVRSYVRDLDKLGWELIPHLDSLAGADGSGEGSRPVVPVFDDDEFFRKKI